MADIPVKETTKRSHVGEEARRIAHEALGATQRLAGADPAVPLRVVLLFLVAVVTMAMAPLPEAAVGEAVLVLLALDVSRHRRA